MKLGLQLNRFDYAENESGIGPAVAAIARRTEDTGMDALWVMDHFFQLPQFGAYDEPMLEGYLTLAFAAAVTERITLGTMVTGVTYRHPAVLVKSVTTLDVLSGGRAYLGIGAGWFQREHAALGIPFPPVAERFEWLEDTLQIAHQLWSDDNGPFDGKRVHLTETICQPQPVRKPHPPILVGGGGERKTLRMVAQYGDACNLSLSGLTIPQVGEKLAVLRRHCDDLGRDYTSIEKTVLGHFRRLRQHASGEDEVSPQQAIEMLGQLSELGVEHVMFTLLDHTDDTSWEIIATEIVPAAQALAAASP